ncbi:MAG: hypothetical protein M3Y33_03935 [Actinomycetota bacterium]|nr:hypothetical protein [Actinomycetota bacterium]
MISPEPLTSRDWRAVETTFLSNKKAPHAVLDGFLSDEACERLRETLLSDHRWHFKHPDSNELYLGAPGGEEIQAVSESLVRRLPTVLSGFQLIHHWAFLHCRSVGLKPHTDAAAVTVNLYLTPDEHNLAPAGNGGLVLSTVRRPPPVSLVEFNSMPWADAYFEREHKDPDVRIGYRYNRAVLFDANLFHASDQISFPDKPTRAMRMNLGLVFDDPASYESRRQTFLKRLGQAEALAARSGSELSAVRLDVAEDLWRASQENESGDAG